MSGEKILKEEENIESSGHQKVNWYLPGIYKTKISKLEELDGCLPRDELKELRKSMNLNPNTEIKLNILKKDAQETSLQHEKAKKELLHTSTELKEVKCLLAIENELRKKLEDELSKFKREASDKSLQHEQTTNELLDVSKQFKEIRSLLEIQKGKSTQLDDELTNARIEFEKQRKFFEEESHRQQQANNDLQGAFVELYKTKSLLEAKTTRLTEELTNKKDELQKLEKLYDDMLNQNGKFQICQNTIAKDFEKFRQWMEEQTSNNHGMTNFTEFSYAELREATNNFNEELKIGKGGYGSVYKGVLQSTTVAIKVLNEGSDQGEREFNQEVETLRKVRHPNLVKLIGACFENWALVYEFLPEGSLQDRLRNVEGRKSLSWSTRIRIASNICSALVFLHHTKPNGIVHGDLKPENILLDARYTCKLIDLGICRHLKLISATRTPHHITEVPGQGTFCYIDPEYQETGKVTTHNDVFAFGVVLLQLVTGRNAQGIRMMVEDALESKKLNEVMDPSANWPLEVAEKMARLGLRCIERLKKKRPDLANEVCVEIESMEQVASRS